MDFEKRENKDDLLRVYEDATLMKNVYEREQAALVDEWLEYLAVSYGE